MIPVILTQKEKEIPIEIEEKPELLPYYAQAELNVVLDLHKQVGKELSERPIEYKETIKYSSYNFKIDALREAHRLFEHLEKKTEIESHYTNESIEKLSTYYPIQISTKGILVQLENGVTHVLTERLPEVSETWVTIQLTFSEGTTFYAYLEPTIDDETLRYLNHKKALGHLRRLCSDVFTYFNALNFITLRSTDEIEVRKPNSFGMRLYAGKREHEEDLFAKSILLAFVLDTEKEEIVKRLTAYDALLRKSEMYDRITTTNGRYFGWKNGKIERIA